MSEIKAGDRVYLNGPYRLRGTVHHIVTANCLASVAIDGMPDDRIITRVSNLRRLVKKPKEKSTRVTRTRLAEIWDNIVVPYSNMVGANDSKTFKVVCTELGLD
jgi:hypothetical protein